MQIGYRKIFQCIWHTLQETPKKWNKKKSIPPMKSFVDDIERIALSIECTGTGADAKLEHFPWLIRLPILLQNAILIILVLTFQPVEIKHAF